MHRTAFIPLRTPPTAPTCTCMFWKLGEGAGCGTPRVAWLPFLLAAQRAGQARVRAGWLCPGEATAHSCACAMCAAGAGPLTFCHRRLRGVLSSALDPAGRRCAGQRQADAARVWPGMPQACDACQTLDPLASPPRGAPQGGAPSVPGQQALRSGAVQCGSGADPLAALWHHEAELCTLLGQDNWGGQGP